ncbi:hypothetical protein DFH07DRAFT_778964 [Mycena maculata]|uniref:Uncharacterized protein n=1 Tax=Mycena maculata TaxID=230809 RepID=A0AAD7IAJ7_9AGAR|nr:hypothetical protein DFH07DRAFT_778964 [Mycena maculata]
MHHSVTAGTCSPSVATTHSTTEASTQKRGSPDSGGKTRTRSGEAQHTSSVRADSTSTSAPMLQNQDLVFQRTPTTPMDAGCGHVLRGACVIVDARGRGVCAGTRILNDGRGRSYVAWLQFQYDNRLSSYPIQVARVYTAGGAMVAVGRSSRECKRITPNWEVICITAITRPSRIPATSSPVVHQNRRVFDASNPLFNYCEHLYSL